MEEIERTCIVCGVSLAAIIDDRRRRTCSALCQREARLRRLRAKNKRQRMRNPKRFRAKNLRRRLRNPETYRARLERLKRQRAATRLEREQATRRRRAEKREIRERARDAYEQQLRSRRCGICGVPVNRLGAGRKGGKVYCSEVCRRERSRLSWHERCAADPDLRARANARKRAKRKQQHRDPQWLAREHARLAAKRANETTAVLALRKLGIVRGNEILTEPPAPAEPYRPAILQSHRKIKGHWRQYPTKTKALRRFRKAFLTVDEVAKKFGVRVHVIRDWDRRGVIAGRRKMRIGGRRRWAWPSSVMPKTKRKWIAARVHRIIKRNWGKRCLPWRLGRIIIVDSHGVARIQYPQKPRHSERGRRRNGKHERQILIAALKDAGWIKNGKLAAVPHADAGGEEISNTESIA